MNPISVDNETQMQILGGSLAEVCSPPAVIYLQGQLGAGKTTLVRGFLRALGYQGHIKSPTYTLVEAYSFPLFNCYHFDLYRVRSADELEDIGFRDYFCDDTICLLEWPEKAAEFNLQADLTIEIKSTGSADCREVGLKSNSRLSKSLINEFQQLKTTL